jgi:hypothetical protein
MKEAILFALLVTLSYSTHGQVPNWSDFKLFAGQAPDYGSVIKVDSKGNYYITASSQNPMNPFILNQPLPPIICNFISPVQNTWFNGILLRYDSARNLNLSIPIENSTLGEFFRLISIWCFQRRIYKEVYFFW